MTSFDSLQNIRQYNSYLYKVVLQWVRQIMLHVAGNSKFGGHSGKPQMHETLRREL